jgi:putative ABC transport system permease protein
MPDWREYVRQHLSLRNCPPGREVEIIEELAQQLDEAYQEGLQSGLGEQDAILTAKRHVADWAALSNELIRAGIIRAARTRHRPADESAPSDKRGRPMSLTSDGFPGQLKSESTIDTNTFGIGIAAIIDTLRQDLYYAGRMFVRQPLFTLLAILTLAIGVGANTAIFSVVNSVLLRPLPYPESNRLAVVWSSFGKEGRAPSSGPELVSLRERSELFDQFGGIWVQGGALTGQGEPEQVKLGWVTSNFLSLLNDRPELGRFFLAREQGPGAAPVVMLSHDLWQRRYGADPKIVGRTILLSGHLCSVVGVLPPEFKLIFPEGASVPPKVDVFVPFLWDLAKQSRDQGYIRIIGRLRDGATLQQGQAELDNIATQLRSEFLEYSGQDLHLQALSLQEDVARNVRPALLALFAGTCFVLLIACTNVAMLLLSRANERKNEMTVRAALGAKPARMIRQLLTESVFLSCLGGTAALLVSWGILGILWRLQPAGIARTAPTGTDFAVLGFNFALSVLCGILFGLSPALEPKGLSLDAMLREASRTTTEGRHFSRRLLIGCEVALTFVLLTSSALLIRTFVELLHVEPGFNPNGVLTFQVSLPDVRYPTAERAIQFVRDAQRTISTLPAVESVGVVSHLPFDDGLPNWYDYFWREGAPQQEQNKWMADHRSVLPGFFDSLGVTFVAGRNFDTSDEVSGRKVVIIDDSLAKQLWPNDDAIGKALNIENGKFVRDVAEVVGVVKHLQYHSLTNQVRPQLYVPYATAVRANMSFTVRSSAAPSVLVPLIRQQMASLDKDLPVANIRLMNDYVSDARMEARFVAVLCGSLGAIALLLSCVGIYGVTSGSVARRTKEIGVRAALGAQQYTIIMMVLRNSMPPVVLGGLLGVALSLALTPLLSGLLFGVQAISPALLASVLGILCFVGLLASFVPTIRVIRGDPIAALRCE